MSCLLECCCDGLEAAREAWAGGADRIELCRDLDTGGLTPFREVIAEAVREAEGRPVNVLVRPREGDFVYSGEEIRRMIEDIAFCREAGANAVVVGALTASGQIDMDAMGRLLEAAAGMHVTFHRAFDECSDPSACLEDIISLGCDRLLSSGHEKDAFVGRMRLADMVSQADGRITVMPGCGINPGNILEIKNVSGAVEFHSSSKGESGRTDRETVKKLKETI